MVTFTLIWFTPMLAKFSTIVPMYPFTRLTRMITAATPIIIPSMVRKERILLPHMLLRASLKDCSIIFYISVKNFMPVCNADHPLCLHSNGIVMGNHNNGISLLIDLL